MRAVCVWLEQAAQCSVYVNLWDTAIKSIFFSVSLFFLLTMTGRNEGIIVELKALFVLNCTFTAFSEGSHHSIRFLAITKNDGNSRL